MKKVLLYVFLPVVVTIGAWYAYTSYVHRNSTTMTWRTYTLERGDVVTYITATGTLSAVTTVQVGTQVSGTISALYADFNDVVRKGQVIAELDTTILYAAKVDAESAVERTQAQLGYAEQELKRTKRLSDGSYSTQADVDQAMANTAVAAASVKSAKAQLQRAVINCSYATIRAPITGTVISRNVDVGQTVVSSMNAPTLMTIAHDLTKMQLQANVAEADIGQVHEKQIVTFTVDAFANDQFQGFVKQVRLQPMMVQNVVNYVVIIDVPNKDQKLMPGLTANLRIQVEKHSNVLRVPLKSLHFNPPQQYFDQLATTDSVARVYRDRKVSAVTIPEAGSKGVLWLYQSDNMLRPVSVDIGIHDSQWVEVTGACNAGDVVVLDLSANGTASAQESKTQNPFMPQMPSNRRTR